MKIIVREIKNSDCIGIEIINGDSILELGLKDKNEALDIAELFLDAVGDIHSIFDRQ